MLALLYLQTLLYKTCLPMRYIRCAWWEVQIVPLYCTHMLMYTNMECTLAALALKLRIWSCNSRPTCYLDLVRFHPKLNQYSSSQFVEQKVKWSSSKWDILSVNHVNQIRLHNILNNSLKPIDSGPIIWEFELYVNILNPWLHDVIMHPQFSMGFHCSIP